MGWTRSAQPTSVNDILCFAEGLKPVKKVEQPFDLSGYEGVVAEVKPSHIEPQPRKEFTPDWSIGIFLIGLIAIAWIRVVFPRQFFSLFRGFMAPRFMRQVMREAKWSR